MLPPTNHTVATLSPLHGRTRLSGHCDELPASLPHKGPPTGTVTGDCPLLGLASGAALLGVMPVPCGHSQRTARGLRSQLQAWQHPSARSCRLRAAPKPSSPPGARPGTPLALICGPGPLPSPARGADFSAPREDIQHRTSEPSRRSCDAPGARQGWRASSGRWAVLRSPTPRPVAFPPPHPWPL